MRLMLFLCFLLLVGGCSKEVVKSDLDKKIAAYVSVPIPIGDVKDLDGLKWETNNNDPVFSDSAAKKGGKININMSSFPLTLRYVGPDSNDGFRSYIDGNKMGLLGIQPVTNNFIPALATAWALGKNFNSVFFKLDKDAKWSDGKPITADDYVFALEFMLSKHIIAPWYNNYAEEFFEKVVKYDDFTIGIFTKKKHSKYEMLLNYGAGYVPEPKHFFLPGLDKDWVVNYQWKVAPNTGAYNISEVKKGKSVQFKRNDNWWAKEKLYYKNRFNVDVVEIKVERDDSVAWQKFLKGELDLFYLNIPEYWHVKSDIKSVEPFAKGYINKLWFYTNAPQPNYGIFLNLDYELFKDINVRKAFGHAMNVDKVIKTVLRGDYDRQYTSQDGRNEYTNLKIIPREFSLAKVDEYMKLAGWGKRGDDGIRVKDGKRMEVVMTSGYAHHQDRMVIIMEEAKKAGIEIKLNLMDGSTAFKSMLEKQHQIAWTAWTGGILPDYWQFYHSDNAHKKQNNNFTNTDDKEMDKLIDDMRNEFDDKKKQELSRKILQREFDLAVYVPTFSVPFSRKGHWRWIQLPKERGVNDKDGPILDPFVMGRFWIDENVKAETLQGMKDGKNFPPVEIIDTTYKRKN